MNGLNVWMKGVGVGVGGQVDTFILDFKKALDTPPHELLKCKLPGYGISGKKTTNFLSNRQQRAIVKIAMDTCLVWCAARHCSRPTVVFLVYK